MNTPATTPQAKSVLIEALHHSRRRDAARVIHRYGHLIADDVESEWPARLAATDACRCARPAENEQEKEDFRMLRANSLIALVLLGFGIAHVVGTTLLLRGATPHVTQAAIVTNQGD
ncbi:hypothetical protein FFI89_022460 [Bradyrhizobium sp. KBS0727]|uniref:hypothetical protein n=1 Tax=unclassified Bradyrhizobium TaxID=2631580 RepID=UPI00110DF4CD|nr:MULTISPECIES: hypothetical protein [unclassified Bradyrhizobium]QDW39660.1 hypothetical protein FFI71_022465 [Bradyrhizobium sp. KBS0725]QDW46263.1 hypothetical protein FFI89_022460 [Bradyrhizobium sp. KBS0727]